jgi:hypothetical protein
MVASLGVFGLVFVANQARADFLPGDAANFVVLYEGAGNNQLNFNQGTINGNIGIGDPSGATTSSFAASGPGTLNGNVLYAGAVPSNQNSQISNTIINGTITGGNSSVQTTLNSLNTLSSTLGSEAGTSVAINLNNGQSQTINASSGTTDGSGNRVFKVTSMTFNNGSTLTINGSASDYVVFNFNSNAQFGGTIQLTGGITSDHVLFNVMGGANLTGGDTVQGNTNGATLTGIFLDPNGAMSINHSVLDGRFFGGDTSNMQIVSGDTLTAPRTPEPASWLLGVGLGTGIFFRSVWRRKNQGGQLNAAVI